MTFWQWLSWVTPFQFSSQKSLCLLCATICNNGTIYIFTMHSVESKLLFYFSLRGLCDTTGQGRLNSEQFALAMYLIHQKVMGVDPPQALQPEMVPPSMRSGSAASPAGGEERVRFSF